MRSCFRKINPFTWSRKTIYISFTLFFSIMLPAYILGFSVFASPVLPQNASLRISSIGIFAPVSPHIQEGKQLQVPNSRIASYTNANKIFLYAHNYSTFRNLDQIQINDKITYTNQDKTSNYSVYDIQTVNTNQINMAKLLENSNSPTLILMTCAGQQTVDNDYSERLIVYAEIEN